ncbi:PREDICTED: probable RNA-dependent RNA polymerase 3-like [Fragaria vesca subsp. vesca]
MFGVTPLPNSVQEALNRLCEVKKQPQPDEGVRRKLSLLSKQDALYVLEQIHNDRAPIKNTLGAFIVFMIGKLENASSSSSSSPRSVKTASSYQISPSASSSSQEHHQDYDREPLYSSASYQSYSCPSVTDAPFYSSFQSQGETSNPLPATLCNGKSLCSSPSPYEILSAPSDAYRQFCERFQGVHISPFQTPSASPVTPVQLYKSFQGETVAHSPVLYHPADHGQAHLEALGELEFRKQFLILSYAGGIKLKDVIDAEDIRNWKNLPMVKFETTVWHVLGDENVGKADRLLNVDWDSGRTHFYECHVTRDGSYTFKGPYIKHERRTLLQKLSGDDNVLIVKFDGEGTKIGSSYKDGGKVDKIRTPSSSPVKCYFVLVSSDAAIDRDVDYWLSNRTIHEGRRLIMHIDTLPSVDKVMARLPLIFSKTTSLELDWSVVKVEIIDDIYCLDDSGNRVYNRDGKALIHTDGTGFISEDLALLCPRIAKRKFTSEEHMEGLLDPDELEIEMTKSDFRTQEAPLLIQCRLFHEGTAAKGTFTVNKLLPPKTLQIRPSMIKVEKDPKFSDTNTINSLEIVCTSAPPMKAYLSRTIIALLVYGGVPKDLFMKILENAVEDAHHVISKTRAALKVAEKYGGIDDFLVETMIRLGIPIEESYLQYRLSCLLRLQEGTGLRKGRLPIPDTFMLMGTADPTGTLERDEVCVILKDGQLSGTVLVYRHPGQHFGDIKVLKATYVKELESVVGDARYAIFFSCKGPRNVADEIAGGDFDGDLYWVSRNPQLLKWYKPSEPWNEGEVATQKVDSKRPTELSDEELQAEMFRLFLKNRFQPCFATGEAANNWIALMDKFLTLGDSQEKKDIMNKILRLVDIYYIALDAAKKGVKVEVPKDLKVPRFPHYMDKLKEEKTETSSSILGEIYDGVGKCQAKLAFLTEIKKLPIFDINQVPEHCLNNWRKLYEQYRGEMSSAMKNANKDQAASSVIGYYKEVIIATLFLGLKLYDAADFEHSSKPIDAILDEAHAIYHVCYDYAINKRDVQRCSFAWKVAGKALCELHAKKTGEKWLSIAPSVLQQLL